MTELNNIELFMLDMDGTLYLGDNIIKGAVEFVDRIKQKGAKVMYFTNNASKDRSLYIEKLTRLGFNADISEIVSSGDVTAAFLNTHRKGKSVYLMGTPACEKQFREAGVNLVPIGEKCDIVVVSFDTTLTYAKVENACTQIMNGAEFLSTHPDINCPTETGFIPDSGAMCAMVSASTGKQPRYFGKPYAETIQMVEEMTGISRDKIAMVGDRIYTDIALGKNNNFTAIMVLSGEGTMEDVNMLEDRMKPDYIFNSVDDILR
ncbi:MAG: HAD-IIA family hydrolase [Clostridia bacterium]|nr:HAD-IIA family hydrolase [Clostridia bacterium]